MKDNFCSHCGSPLGKQDYPKKCAYCEQFAYNNPLPIALVLVPVGNGILLVRRNIEPAIGELALPGGFMNYGETWQQACVRELHEETGLVVASNRVKFCDMHSTERHLLVFATIPRYQELDLSKQSFDHEVKELIVSHDHNDITKQFPLHRIVAESFLNQLRLADTNSKATIEPSK